MPIPTRYTSAMPDPFPQIWSGLTIHGIESLLSNLTPKLHGEKYAQVTCPECGKREAFCYAPKDSKGPRIHCNRKKNCTFDKTLFDYLKEQNGGDGSETLKQLARAANVEIGGVSAAPFIQRRGASALQRVSVSAQSIAPPQFTVPDDILKRQARYVEMLADSPAEAYLLDRGVSLHQMRDYGFGYGLTWPFLREDGAVYENMIDRVSFPLTNKQGEIVALIGRLMKDGSPKYSVYGAGSGVFVCQQGIWQSENIILVEGVFDVLALDTLGLPAIAIIGTNCPEWLLRHCAYRSVRVGLDADTAGETKAEKIISKLQNRGAAVSRLAPPDAGKDWGDYLKDGGAEAVRMAYARTPAAQGDIDAERQFALVNHQIEMAEFGQWLEQFARRVNDPLAQLAAASLAGRLLATPYAFSTPSERWEGNNLRREVYVALRMFWREPSDETRRHAETFAAMWQEMQSTQVGRELLRPYRRVIEAAQAGELSFTVAVGDTEISANQYVRHIAEPIFFGELLGDPRLARWLECLAAVQLRMECETSLCATA